MNVWNERLSTWHAERKRTASRLIKMVALFCVWLALVMLARPVVAQERTAKPNFVIVFADDLGYSDIGCFGAKQIRTPNLDQMAQEGMRLTHFYAQTVCGPSRAALMTGCYPLRTAKRANDQKSVHPFLHSKEITIAEVLKDQGYATGCFGKWDLAGHKQAGYDVSLMPNRQGFDEYFGTPSSNDSIVNLVHNDKVVEPKADMATLTQRFTNHALSFIREHKDEPFFVYLPHTMPHIRLAASKEFAGKSSRGLYGDVVEELDDNVGRILKLLTELDLQDETYVIFTSDNGPWYLDGHARLSKQRDKGGSHGGDADPLRGHKTSSWEGGVRVPTVVWAPGRVEAGTTSSKMAATIDLLPTLARLAGGKQPSDRIIDGNDISDLIHGKQSAVTRDTFYYYVHTQLMAVRKGRWKLHLQRRQNTMKNWDVFQKQADVVDLSSAKLFDLESDPGEQSDLTAKHPAVVKELSELAESARRDIGDFDRIGEGARFFDPQPRRTDIRKP